MVKFRYQELNGKTYEQKVLKEESAFPFIEKRIERAMPIETVEADAIKKTVSGIAIDCQRSITPEEAYGMVDTIKNFIISEIDNAEKFYIDRKVREVKKIEK